MKEEVRVMAVDDGPFVFGDEAAFLVGLVVRGRGYLEAMYSTTVSLEALDATATLTGLVNGTRQRPQLKAVLLDGLTLAGFNVVDVDALHLERHQAEGHGQAMVVLGVQGGRTGKRRRLDQDPVGKLGQTSTQFAKLFNQALDAITFLDA